MSVGGVLLDPDRGFGAAGGVLLDLDRGFGADDGASPDEDSDLIEAFDFLSPRVRRLFACGANSLYLCGV